MTVGFSGGLAKIASNVVEVFSFVNLENIFLNHRYGREAKVY
jgi:hypothetical protein